MKMLDIYAGIGGASLGAKIAGIEPVYAFETDPLAQTVFATNLGVGPAGDPLLADIQAVPHPDVVFASPTKALLMALNMRQLLLGLRPRAILIEMPSHAREIIDWTRAFMVEDGYNVWVDRMLALEYGIPMRRTKTYVVCFRKDIKTYFSHFPFPDRRPSKTLRGLLEPTPDPGLFIGDKFEKVIKRNASRASAGVGYRTKVLTEDDVAPSLPLDYHKNRTAVLVDQGGGPRRLSVLECKRLMGFPDDWRMPIPDAEAYRLLAAASCPPVVGCLLSEIKDWIDF